MRKISFLLALAYLACSVLGHGSTGNWRTHPAKNHSLVPLASLDRVPDSWSKRDAITNRMFKPLEILTGLFLALDSEAAFKAGPGVIGLHPKHQHRSRGRSTGDPTMFWQSKVQSEMEVMKMVSSQMDDVKAAAEKYGVQQPYYRTLRAGEYKKQGKSFIWEIREYQAMQVAKVAYDIQGQAYRALTEYTADGKNEKELAMPSTGPVLNWPIQPPNRKKTCAYIMPNPHTPFDPKEDMFPAPKPKGGYRAEDIELMTIPKSHYVVARLGEWTIDKVVLETRDTLAAIMKEKGFELARGAMGPRIVTAQYSAVFALPWNLDNEVWLPLVSDQDFGVPDWRPSK